MVNHTKIGKTIPYGSMAPSLAQDTGSAGHDASCSPRFLSCGDTAVAVEFGDTIDRALSERVLHLRDRLRAAALPGVITLVPTFRSLMIHYDPLMTDRATLEAATSDLMHAPDSVDRTRRSFEIPVCYEDAMAPDLSEVATRVGMSPDEVVAVHGAVRYHVYMVGFVPGYPYLGDLPESLSLPRREDPRVHVPPGSVAIAASMTAVYPLQSPGGWHLIGNTPAPMFDASWASPALLGPGDAVRFVAIDARRHAELQAASRARELGPGDFEVSA